MPQADPVTVRIAANRAAAVAAELQRLHGHLSGATARDGWTGSARLAFDDAMADRLARFGPVIDRYDTYAAALITYARELEQALPALRVARLKLDNSARGPDGSAEDGAELNFNRLWQNWDDARRRCASGLGDAGRIGADRHGLSALWHSATHVAHEVVSHVDLADISKALSELGDVLFVAALVLSPVPGLGEVLWAAVAVVAVAQFAVDGARYAGGDKSVTKGDLAWDAVGALPGGAAGKAVKLAKEAKKARDARTLFTVPKRIDGLATEAKEVKLVPGGGLMAHEAPNSPIGHTLQKHVGKSYNYLVGRFTSRFVSQSSSFYDRAIAEHAMSGAMAHADKHIQEWIASPMQRMRITAESNTFVGVTIHRLDRAAVPTKHFLINLEKDSNMKLGYYIPTAHPTLAPQR